MSMRRSEGQSLIEFALTLPVLAILMVGSLSIGRAAYDAMIVQEVGVEAGKMAAIDRMQGDSRHSMDEGELLNWIREAAHFEDTSIAPLSIQCNPNWRFNAAEVAPGMPKDGDKTYKGLSKFLSGGDLASWLNPSLETMRLRYKHDTGFGGGVTIPIDYVFHFTRYEMTWLPINKNIAKSNAICP